MPDPPPTPKHKPLTETQPLESAMPPENVEVDVFVTFIFVTVVVPKLESPTASVPPDMLTLLIEPPFIVGLFITVLVS